ncbi:MAG TPA: MBL fold metallo-hydrolase, partial [Planctomycetales bacterium]|nr:MBL fold metallo-hydrolase [Planctomycetales bacterium]
MHLVEAAGRRILLDCGLVHGKKDEARKRNASFPFAPLSIDAVVLSHAHIDHCGNLPNLVRQGFDGPIYCTPATRDLLAVVLGDSARVKGHAAVAVGATHGNGAASGPPPRLYTRSDADRAVLQCVAVPYEMPHEIAAGIQLRFLDAGHILGSAIIRVTARDNTGERTIVFSGDIGRPGTPIVRDPTPIRDGDYLLIESTYGGRTHEPEEEAIRLLGEVVTATYDTNGVLLVPSFAIGRTQEIVYELDR